MSVCLLIFEAKFAHLYCSLYQLCTNFDLILFAFVANDLKYKFFLKNYRKDVVKTYLVGFFVELRHLHAKSL